MSTYLAPIPATPISIEYTDAKGADEASRVLRALHLGLKGDAISRLTLVSSRTQYSIRSRAVKTCVAAQIQIPSWLRRKPEDTDE